MSSKNKTILSVAPWIYDFAAYDLWVQPLGLLRLSTELKDLGFDVHFINCLDRYDPGLLKMLKRTKPRDEQKYGCGRFYKEPAEKPEALKPVGRSYYRYGLPVSIFREKLKNIGREPDIILLSQVMTYWYPGTQLAAKILKEVFPSSKIVLGGVYSILMPEHAKKYSGADAVFSGSDFDGALELVLRMLGEEKTKTKKYGFEGIQRFDYSFLTDRRTAVLETSRGCPHRCRYCSQHHINRGYSALSAERVMEDILFYREKYGSEYFVFYDDALAYKKEEHLLPLLRKIKDFISKNSDASFHLPNGLSVREVDGELAGLLFECRFRTLRLSLETTSAERQAETGGKVTNRQFKSAVGFLGKAGYLSHEIEVYTLMGLPGQSMEEIRRDIDFIFDAGASPVLTAYSPTPGSHYFEEYFKEKLADPLLQNNTVFSLQTPDIDEEMIRQLRMEVKKRKQDRFGIKGKEENDEMV